MKHLLKLFMEVKKYKKWLWLIPIFLVLDISVDLFLPNITANIINVGLANRDYGYIAIYTILMLVLTLFGIIGGICSTYYSAKISGHVAGDIRLSLFKKIMRLPIIESEKKQVGNLITILTTDTNSIDNIFMMIIRILFRLPIILLGSIIMAIFISPKMSLVLTILIPIMILIVTMAMKKSFPYFDQTEKEIDEINDLVRDNVSGMRVVKSHVNEDYEKEKFKKRNQSVKNINLKAVSILLITMPVMNLIISLSTVYILWYGGKSVILFGEPIGNLVAFIQYLNNIMSAIIAGSAILLFMVKSEVSATRILEVLNLKEKKEEGNIKEGIDGNISFEKVLFSYEKGLGDNVLTDISFSIKEGEMIGIIGPTGAGKSTLVNLLNRLYSVESKQIKLGNSYIEDYDIDYLRKNIGIVLQQPYLFRGTIMDSLKYSNKKLKKKEIDKVIKGVCLDNLIQNSAKKYNSPVLQKGSNLSGGEKQRLSIARTLLSKPNILVLDDSLNAVDAQTENKIIEFLKNNYQAMTTLIISNKLSSLKHCNRIMVIHDGKLQDIGTHSQLLKRNDFYKSIYSIQKKKGVK